MIVDDADFELVNQYVLFEHPCGYAIGYMKREFCGKPCKGNYELIHRVIMGVKKDRFVDHINHNKLDNRRSNLRVCTKGQNNANKRAFHVIGGRKYKGVSRDSNGTWRARIKVHSVERHIGVYRTPQEAAIAYDQEAKKHFKEFAVLNFN